MAEERPVVEVQSVEGGAVARLTGDLDIVSADDVKRQLVDTFAGGAAIQLTLDLSDVGFVDSSGLGVLVAVHGHADAAGGRLVIRGVPPSVHRLFEITRLGDLLVIEP